LELIASSRLAAANGVVVLGPAGVGKSRLAREALAQAEREGATTTWIQATRSAASVPLGAFAGVIPSAARFDDLLELMQLSVQALRELAGTQRLVVGVDDAQLLDPTSAALVLHLTINATAFVVATIRSGEPCPDAITSLWKDAGAIRLELESLTEIETETLTETIVGGPVEQGARRWISETSRGNALYVRELVLGALAGGALKEVNGLWRLPVRPPVSASLAELITARMTGLTDPELKALELLALGEPLRLSELIALTGRDPRGTPRSTAAGRAANRALAARCRRADRHRATRGRRASGEPRRRPHLGAELATQAMGAGAGIQAALLLARAHTIQNQFDEAETVLAAAEPGIDTQAMALDYLEQQSEVLYWGLKRPERLRELLMRAEAWWPDREWQGRLVPLRLRIASFEGPGATVSASAEILASEDLDPEIRRQVEPLHAASLFYSALRDRGRSRRGQCIRARRPARLSSARRGPQPRATRPRSRRSRSSGRRSRHRRGLAHPPREAARRARHPGTVERRDCRPARRVDTNS
jgi:hypothetical protein